MWIKLGILLTGFTYAGLLPYFIKKTLKIVDFDLKLETLSFLSNKKLYGADFEKGYKRLLFVTAILNYIFFWLLSVFYDLGEHENLMRYIDYSFAFLTLLAFVPHNMGKYSFEHLGKSLKRIIHNFLAVLVFLILPLLIINFQVAIYNNHLIQGITGLIIISITVILTAWSILSNGLNGVSEMIFINGISIWSILTTIITLIR
ncbi:MAG TPA: hypothetical protein VJY41_07560 [Prolixibacteraceae bacterium]|nr:hypothetical protein [Prolixibacteraceae bacterium]